MTADDAPPDDALAGIPLAPLSFIVNDAIKSMSKLGNMPGQPASLAEMYVAIKERIQRINLEILESQNRDDVAAAQAKLALMQEEERKILDGARRVAVEGLLRGVYTCAGHLDGRRVVIPMSEWSGAVDWKDETLQSRGRVYRHVRTIVGGKLTPEQDKMVKRRRAGGPAPLDQEPASGGFPGRPTSKHLVEAEFQRRVKAGEIEQSLQRQAEVLAIWLRKVHSEMPQAEVKTIVNNLREAYRSARKNA